MWPLLRYFAPALYLEGRRSGFWPIYLIHLGIWAWIPAVEQQQQQDQQQQQRAPCTAVF